MIHKSKKKYVGDEFHFNDTASKFLVNSELDRAATKVDIDSSSFVKEPISVDDDTGTNYLARLSRMRGKID